MNFQLRNSHKDLLTIAVLSVVFFLIAATNFGLTQVPVSNWQTAKDETVLIDLGAAADVNAVYLCVKNGSANIQVFSGSPENWTDHGQISIEYPQYYTWKSLTINEETQYLRLSFEQANVEIAEIAVLDQSNQKLSISAVTAENISDPNLPKLIDEQNLVQLPPTYMSETIFDEVYFVRTAEQYLHVQLPYEWTHPPLGKIIIASGIAIFGFNPFGWRIMGVIFATLLIPLIYFMGKKLLGTWIGGFAAAFLLTFDFMHFTMSRMATTDTFLVFFSLASQLFFLIYLKNVLKDGWETSLVPLFLATTFFALSFSVKWLVLYGFAAQLVILAALRLRELKDMKNGIADKINAFFNHPFFWILGFLWFAVLIYFLTYIPDMLAGRSFSDVINLQGYMYQYHATLTEIHTYSSPWWSWPLISKPVWLYVSYLPAGIKSTIALLGNPAVWWIGFACMLLATVFAVIKRNFACMFIAVFFFFQWLPYLFISRAVFLYHFYVNVPFLCLAAAFFISKYWRYRWMKAAALVYFAVVVLLFILFYPVISGAPAPTSTIDSLKWLGGWTF